MTTADRNLGTRAWLIDRLRAEIIGPDPVAHADVVIDDGVAPFRFESWEQFRKPKLQPNGEEVLWQDRPTKRYGAGILYPAEITDETILQNDPEESEAGDAAAAGEEPLNDRALKAIDRIADETTPDDLDSFDVTLANAYRPSAMGISFLALVTARSSIRVEIKAATYRKRAAVVNTPSGDRTQELWLRVPLRGADDTLPVITLSPDDLRAPGKLVRDVPGAEQHLQIVVLKRPHADREGNARLLTVSLVNRQARSGGIDPNSYFQVGLAISVDGDEPCILPYPDPSFAHDGAVSEESINKLLYRDRHTFAVGHGCAASWNATTTPGGLPRATAVSSETLPTEETPSITADLLDANGVPIRVDMRDLAGVRGAIDFSEIERLLVAYSSWIDSVSVLDPVRPVVPNVPRPSIPPAFHATAEELVRRCHTALARMRRGLARIQSDPIAQRAFVLANEVMLLSQLRASRDVRVPTWVDRTATIEWSSPPPEPNPAAADTRRGYWRAFQIAFLLQSIEGICEPESFDRSIVDVIWFPTGGGKTEAYLGLTAFTLLYDRLAGRSCAGATVLMRYTLRLLTTQQFQRAGLLFCALEDVRNRHRAALGERPFTLGMWVGGTSTPNRRADAVAALGRLERDPADENPFVLLKCPWCNAQFGPTTQRGSAIKVYGYRRARVSDGAATVVYRCNDTRCPFGRRDLPLVVIDEDLYAAPPDLVIGTVDKFAQLAWNPSIRSLFGIASDGSRLGAAPSLIIQDELHLIAGPLGSMVGAYETVVDELCTYDQEGIKVRPKIIASTATISRAADQVRAVFARANVAVFPPSGLEAGDSFFAREARDADGKLMPGRLYTGIMATAHGSMQTTQARVFATLLQNVGMIEDATDAAALRDPWWTLLSFFNSLRELGGAATLLVADARDYLRVLIDRQNLPYTMIRQLRSVEELTSRIRSDEVPRAIQKLERRYTGARGDEAVDCCLASSIIEVGVDIDRLSLMTITGQPKTTAQYIQVSSRIGRSADAPGLVVTLYSPSKPRDRSHFERFTSYHRRLYAQVEPTSVTPFSPPAVERALHGIIVSLVRQLRPLSAASDPRPFTSVVDGATRAVVERVIRERVLAVDSPEWNSVAQVLSRRFAEWQAWDPSQYGTFGSQPPDAPLIFPAGMTPRDSWNAHGWPTLTSLRDVDATCEAHVTQVFNDAGGTQ